MNATHQLLTCPPQWPAGLPTPLDRLHRSAVAGAVWTGRLVACAARTGHRGSPIHLALLAREAILDAEEQLPAHEELLMAVLLAVRQPAPLELGATCYHAALLNLAREQLRACWEAGDVEPISEGASCHDDLADFDPAGWWSWPLAEGRIADRLDVLDVLDRLPRLVAGARIEVAAAARQAQRRREPEPEVASSMLSLRDLAAKLGVGKATVERMKAAGRLPAHVEVSPGCHRWRAAEIHDWLDAGCPPRREWEARRRAAR